MVKKNRLSQLFMLLGATNARPYDLIKPNSAFYLPSGSTPSALPSQCIEWYEATSDECKCKNVRNDQSPDMMIDPSAILPSYYLKRF